MPKTFATIQKLSFRHKDGAERGIYWEHIFKVNIHRVSLCYPAGEDFAPDIYRHVNATQAAKRVRELTTTCECAGYVLVARMDNTVALTERIDLTLIQTIRGWMDDIRVMNTAQPPCQRMRTAMLVYCYNWATNPAALYTDREHALLRCLSRWCLRMLANRTGWHEQDSGRLAI